MASGVIRSLSLPGTSEARSSRSRRIGIRRPPSLHQLPSLRTAEVACEVTSIDKVGRLAAPGLLKYLAWEPGTKVSLSEKGGLLLLTPDPQGAQAVTKARHVCLPAHIRHWHRLTKGTQLLLVADPQHDYLIVHPPAALDGVAQLHRSLLGGDAQ